MSSMQPSGMWFLRPFPYSLSAPLTRTSSLPQTLLYFPEIYKDVQNGQDFNGWVFVWWMIDSMWVGLVIYFVPMWVLNPEPIMSNGEVSEKWILSFTSFACCSTVCNFRLILKTKTWTHISWMVMAFSVISYFIFSFFYMLLPPVVLGNFEGVVEISMQTPGVWLCLFISVLLTMIPVAIQIAFKTFFLTTETMKVRRKENQILQKLRSEGRPFTEKIVKESYEKYFPHEK
eukprot:NODE_5270_length_1039_cov_32.067686_g4706_i0.p1 GENE.NODE_5270_length_1039_cov_32.067686_g4706_i0~~NODE_5270_length_1039_cov_32.067686_g4706_i0.p1  ORF type:complete len:231 (-),score=9.58 NODE_5270_length_1039_cov_32.067686_g4706_i0:214-906(-)